MYGGSGGHDPAAGGQWTTRDSGHSALPLHTLSSSHHLDSAEGHASSLGGGPALHAKMARVHPDGAPYYAPPPRSPKYVALGASEDGSCPEEEGGSSGGEAPPPDSPDDWTCQDAGACSQLGALDTTAGEDLQGFVTPPPSPVHLPPSSPKFAAEGEGPRYHPPPQSPKYLENGSSTFNTGQGQARQQAAAWASGGLVPRRPQSPTYVREPSPEPTWARGLAAAASPPPPEARSSWWHQSSKRPTSFAHDHDDKHDDQHRGGLGGGSTPSQSPKVLLIAYLATIYISLAKLS